MIGSGLASEIGVGAALPEGQDRAPFIGATIDDQ